MADDFEKKLLTDGGKWWEFLDPETYEVRTDLPGATRSTGEQLDWSRRKVRRPGGPVSFGFFVHCSRCGNPVPPDFTFCVRCGGEPRSANPTLVYSLIIEEVDDADALEAAISIVSSAGKDLQREEIAAVFADPPAVFNLTARKDQVAALVMKLAEIGVPVRSFPVDHPSLPWIREAMESIARQPAKLLATFVLVLGTLAASFAYSVLFLPIGLLALGSFVVRELGWYRDHFHLDTRKLLQTVTGFDAQTERLAVETLSTLSDREVREHVTVCLMEYYSLTHQLRAHEPLYGAVLSNTRHALEELMANVLGLAHRYAKLDSFLAANPPAAAHQRLEELRSGEVSDPAAARLRHQEAAALEEQLDLMENMENARGAFRERIGVLASNMEAMRARIAAVRARPTEEAWRAAAIDEALAELDREFEVFEETFAVVGQS